MKKILTFTIVCSLLLMSCASTAHLPVPGEGEVVKGNIYTEYYAIGDAYNDLAKYDKAITYYKKAMKSKKLYWSAYYKLGKAYVSSKNWTEAENVFDALLKRDPGNLSLKMSLAYISAMSGNLNKALDLYTQLWNDNQENADILVNYINVQIALEKNEEAKLLFENLKEKFKDNKNIADFEKYFKEQEEKLAKEAEKESAAADNKSEKSN